MNQLKFPDNKEISMENALTKLKNKVVNDILMCYTEWKNKVSYVKGSCINHIIWANDKITDIGSQLWNANLIARGNLYVSDFLTVDKNIFSYDQFREKWDINATELTKREYVDIKWLFVVLIVPQLRIRISPI